MFDNKEKPKPVIFGCAGTSLNAAERTFFKSANPFGFILFKRNCSDPEQVRWLIKELLQTVDRDDAPILMDQEGGRVSRLSPPHWQNYPAARVFGDMYERDAEGGSEAIHLYARIVANDLSRLGITVNCAPVVDLFIEEASSAIGDRAFSSQPAIVAALARMEAEAFLANGILPVIKHFPGHGRLTTDPHETLPTIETSRAELECEDFVPFELLKDLPIGMNSHAIFSALDPKNAASMSTIVQQDIIRDLLGFDGLLLSDDICMKALRGSPAERAQRALEAGADVVLHCNGLQTEMEAIAHVLEPMNDESWKRWDHAKSMVKKPDPFYNLDEDRTRLDILLGGFAYNVEAVA